MIKKDLTILVVSYDGYKDMWPKFFKCIKKNWPDNPFDMVLSNNEEDFQSDKVRVIHCGKDAQWSTRTRVALEAISTKYVCFLLEDFFISKPVNTSVIEDVLNTMDKCNINYYKLMSLSKIGTPYFNKEKGERIIPSNLKYGISLLAAIWKRDYFLELIGNDNYNPWRFEIERNEDAEKGDNTMCGLYNEQNILNICHMVVQGKYLPTSIKKMEKEGFIIDSGSRGVHSRFYELKNTFKDLFYPKLRDNSFLVQVSHLLGIETVTSKNK